MDPTFWIAHILALHLNVPEPVKFETAELWPSPNRAQIELVAGDAWIVGCTKIRQDHHWLLRYNIDDWNKHNTYQRRFIIAHELCHTVYEYHINWDQLDKKEQKRRHKFVNECAEKIMRDHKDCRW